jgi:hypothetical protein
MEGAPVFGGFSKKRLYKNKNVGLLCNNRCITEVLMKSACPCVVSDAAGFFLVWVRPAPG